MCCATQRAPRRGPAKANMLLLLFVSISYLSARPAAASATCCATPKAPPPGPATVPKISCLPNVIVYSLLNVAGGAAPWACEGDSVSFHYPLFLRLHFLVFPICDMLCDAEGAAPLACKDATTLQSPVLCVQTCLLLLLGNALHDAKGAIPLACDNNPLGSCRYLPLWQLASWCAARCRAFSCSSLISVSFSTFQHPPGTSQCDMPLACLTPT